MRTVKCVITGDPGVGKTALVRRLVQDTFDPAATEVVYDNSARNLRVGGEPVQVSLWDTASTSDYDRLRPLSYLQADVVLICFSLVSTSSLDNVRSKWLPEAQQHAPADAGVFLVATKMDLQRARAHLPVTQAQIDDMLTATILNGSQTCSALTGDGVVTAVRQAIARRPSHPRKHCLLTTACVTERGLADDCDALQVQRHLRDTYVATLPNGPALIAEYYATAPALLRAIDAAPDRTAILDEVYQVVQRCVRLTRDGRAPDALAAYIALCRGLERRFDVTRDGYVRAS